MGNTDLAADALRRSSLVGAPAEGASLVGWKPKFSSPKIASVRTRCLNPMRELRERCYPVELFDAERSHLYRAVVYSKLYDDATYSEALALKERGVTIVLDLCDNHFYHPADPALQRHISQQLRRMMMLADHWVASTETMAEVMLSEAPESRPIRVIGDAVEVEPNDASISALATGVRHWRQHRTSRWLRSVRSEGRVSLVWFGVHGGSAAPGMADLLRIMPILEDQNREHPIALTVISNSRLKYRELIRPCGIRTRYQEWSPLTFLTDLRAHAIALLPITPNPFTRCKSNNRLVTALHSGLAVVADTIPSYSEFAGVCVLDDWDAGLRQYLTDPNARGRDVAAGQAIIQENWTSQRIADQWRRLFDELPARV